MIDDIEALVFDMDGVLVDSAPIHVKAFLRVLSSYGITSFDYDVIAGMRTRDAMRLLLSNVHLTLDEATVDALSLAKRAAFRELTKGGPPLMEGAVATVRAIATLGYRLALASSGSESSVNAFLSSSGVASLFDVVLHGEDVALAKPSPEIYLLTAKRLGLDPSHMLVVEDSISGIRAAHTAGARVVAFRSSKNIIASLHGVVVSCANSLSDVLKLVAER